MAPRHRNVPPAASSAGLDAVDLAASAGLFLDDWQRDVLVDALGERDDARWAALEVALIVPRQNGKGSILEALELYMLFLGGARLILHSAHEFKTASEAFLRINTLVTGSPALSRRVRRVYTAHGQEGIELVNGARLKFVARSKGSGRGFSGDLVILDEAYNLSDKAIAALMPTLSARENPQIWYTSSAPFASDESDVLRRLCKRGRKGSGRLCYVEYCAADDAGADDPAAWMAANPSLGIRINDDFIETERGALSDEDFARERLGLWEEEGEAGIIPVDKFDVCSDPGGRLGVPRCIAFDVAPGNTYATVAVAGIREDGHPQVELTDRGRGSRWLLDRLPALRDSYGCPVLYDPAGPAGEIARELGFEPEPVTVRDHSHACGAFLAAVVEERLRHIGQLELRAAVLGAGKRDVGDLWLWARARSRTDISPLVACTLALWGAMPPAGPERQWFGAYA